MTGASTEQTRVLIVDDEPKVADLFEIWLRDEYDVRTAYSGEAALERMADREADVVLLDRQMPDLSGDEVADRLDQNGYDAQVVMVTAVSPSPQMAALPVDDYVIKPIRSEQLRDIVKTAALVRTYDEDVGELLALTARKQTLEQRVSADKLEASTEFGLLVSKVADIQDSIDDTMEELWSQTDTDVFARIEGRLTGTQVEN